MKLKSGGVFMIKATNVMDRIEKTKGNINPRYDISCDVIKIIIDNSTGDTSAVCNGFRLGYIQGMKAEKSKSKK